MTSRHGSQTLLEMRIGEVPPRDRSFAIWLPALGMTTVNLLDEPNSPVSSFNGVGGAGIADWNGPEGAR